jgi:hypothetical protein
MLFGTMGMNVPLNPVSLYARHGEFQADRYHEQLEEALAEIPPDASVATINRLGPPLVNRRALMALEYPPPLRMDHLQMVEYVLLDLVDCRYAPAPDPRASYREIVAQILGTGDFEVRYWSGRILLLERGEPSNEEGEEVLAYADGLVQQGRPCWP